MAHSSELALSQTNPERKQQLICQLVGPIVVKACKEKAHRGLSVSNTFCAAIMAADFGCAYHGALQAWTLIRPEPALAPRR